MLVLVSLINPIRSFGEKRQLIHILLTETHMHVRKWRPFRKMEAFFVEMSDVGWKRSLCVCFTVCRKHSAEGEKQSVIFHCCLTFLQFLLQSHKLPDFTEPSSFQFGECGKHSPCL